MADWGTKPRKNSKLARILFGRVRRGEKKNYTLDNMGFCHSWERGSH